MCSRRAHKGLSLAPRSRTCPSGHLSSLPRLPAAMRTLGTLLSVLSVLVAADTGFQVARRQDCQRLQMYNHYIETIMAGQEWRERCRTCSCQGGEVTCTLDPGTTCQNQYDPSVDRACIQWDRNECCCLRLGCRVNGKNYDLGQTFMAEWDGFCSTHCVCSPFSGSVCLKQCLSGSIRTTLPPPVDWPLPPGLTAAPGDAVLGQAPSSSAAPAAGSTEAAA